MSFAARARRTALALGASVALTLSVVSPISAIADTADSEYIIQVPESQQDELLNALSDLGVTPDVVYDNSLSGVAVSLTPSELAAVNTQVSGENVAPDLPVELMTAQAPAPWNLAMIDSATRPADQTYIYPDSAGDGVRVYVIDTGIASNNPQLSGRVLPGVSLVAGDPSTSDCYGHGTHVAGTVASTTYGVAKRASVVPIRVFNCSGGGATESKILAGIDWAIANKPAGTVGVINMSLGLSCFSNCSMSPLVVGVQKAVDANFVVVVSAGNSSRDACTFSPASAPAALTVGALDQTNTEASWSNFGPCVDLYAPGVDIVSLNYQDALGTKVMSGTSMAAPHVAGAAALYIAANPGASALAVTQAIKDGASASPIVRLVSHPNTPNAQLNTSPILTNATVGVAPPAPSSLSAVAFGIGSIDLSWQPVAALTAVTDYIVSYRPAGTSSWITTSTTPSAATSERVSGLVRDTSYEFRVVAKTDVVGPTSNSVFARTLTGMPTRVSTPTVSALQATSLTLSWPAATAPGSAVTDYETQYRLLGLGTWTPVPHVASTATTATITGLTPSRTYELRVRGVSPFGTGPWSLSAVSVTPSGIPGAPSSVTATSATATSLAVTWVASTTKGAPIRDYIVEYKRSTETTWRTWADGVSASTGTTISNLAPGSTYQVRVSAKSDFGIGPTSISSSAVTLNGKPLRLTTLNANPGTTSVSLDWAPATANGAPVIDYVIDYRKLNSGVWTRYQDGVSATPGVTIPGLTRNETYYVRVLAVSAFGNSTALSTSVRTLP